MTFFQTIRLTSLAALTTLTLAACASGIIPVQISNGSVGGSNRITADASNGSILGFSTNSDNHNHYLADVVRTKLAAQCTGGKLENISLDMKQHAYFGIYFKPNFQK
ncbi:hypothetical protein [Leptospirillum ferriphilum]|uniref:Lipoprotein n=1 Tax=Leptospirillum ferriphilum (strain ML-04) TaxID=1048260 RepID=J9ZCP0_LEPFM|nr:hypothetical protein [Leptospirillum ferriphilum]AFS53911.1 hypothetical protein LFML04_1709 [Leptospirillum ferriphilum ML-04]